MEKQKNVGRNHFRNDVIFIISVLTLCVISLVYLFVFRKEGNTVMVTVDGEIYGTYSLAQNTAEELRTGKDGENVNLFVISDGKVYMKQASCPDGICVAHRPVFRDGESIVCLPNRVVITVVTDSGNDTSDIVA